MPDLEIAENLLNRILTYGNRRKTFDWFDLRQADGDQLEVTIESNGSDSWIARTIQKAGGKFIKADQTGWQRWLVRFTVREGEFTW